MKSTIRIDIIIVNWNSGSLAQKAIAPYVGYASENLNCVVHIVDNGSTDNSVELFAAAEYNLIANEKNLGFGKACNLAYDQCKGEYILLLNPDTQSSPDILENLVSFLENNSEYAVVGPKQIQENNETIRSCGRFPNVVTAWFDVMGLSKISPSIFPPAPIMKDWDHQTSRAVDHVMGSYMLIRKAALEKTGFMDEDYFVYMEDLDLSKRLHNAGYKTYFEANCTVMHIGGGTGAKVKAKRLFYSLSSRRLYWKKHLGYFSMVVLTLFSFTAEPVLRIIDAFLGKNKTTPADILKAYSAYWISLFK